MSNIDRIIAAARKDSRTVSGSETRALCDEIERLRQFIDDPDAHVEGSHGASGLCCELRRQAVGRAELAESELTELRAAYAAEVREHEATKETLREAVAEKHRLVSIVTLARMLIQPTAVGGPILEGHQRFREDLMRAVRGMKYTDPRDAELARLRTLEEAAIHWNTHRCVHGVGRLERAIAEAAREAEKAEPRS